MTEAGIARRLEAGLCVYCGGPGDPEGRTRCAKCRKIKAEKWAEKCAERMAAGLCTRCAAAVSPGERDCAKCVKRRRKREKNATAMLTRTRRCWECKGKLSDEEDGRNCRPCADRLNRRKRPDATRRVVQWKPSEERRLGLMVRDLKTAAEIAAVFGKTKKAIRMKVHRMGLGWPAREWVGSGVNVYDFATARRAA